MKGVPYTGRKRGTGKGAREKFTDVLTGDFKVRYQDTVKCLQNTKDMRANIHLTVYI